MKIISMNWNIIENKLQYSFNTIEITVSIFRINIIWKYYINIINYNIWKCLSYFEVYKKMQWILKLIFVLLKNVYLKKFYVKLNIFYNVLYSILI